MFTKQFKLVVATLVAATGIGALGVREVSLQNQINTLKETTPSVVVVTPTASPSATLTVSPTKKPTIAYPTFTPVPTK